MTDREIKQSGIQNIGYIEREDGELILTNFDPSKPSYIISWENMTSEQRERAQEKIVRARKQAAIDTSRKRENAKKPSDSGS